MLTIFSMFFRAGRVILISFAVLAMLIGAYLLLKPEKFKAHMSFLVRTERAEPLVGADPRQNSIQLAGVTEADLNSEVELLNSTGVLRQVVVATSLQKEYRGDADATIEKAVKKLGKHLSITPVRNSSLIDVEYDSPVREQAANVLKELARIYLQERMNLHAASGAGPFFSEQRAVAQAGLQEAEAQRALFLQGKGYGGLPQQMQLTQSYVQDLQRQLDDAQASLTETRSRLHQVFADRWSAPARIATQQRVATNPYAFEQLTTTLVNLQNKRTELLVKFKPDDRVVLQTEAEIRTVQEAIQKTESAPAQDKMTDVNPLRQSLDTEANRLTQTEIGLIGRIRTLRSQLSEQQARLVQMQSDTARVDDLERNVKSATDRFDLYEGKAVASKIADDLDARQISNVILSTRPTVPALPEQSPLNVFTGIALAAVLSLSLGFATQLLAKRLHGPSAIEEQTGIPILATLPVAT